MIQIPIDPITSSMPDIIQSNMVRGRTGIFRCHVIDHTSLSGQTEIKCIATRPLQIKPVGHRLYLATDALSFRDQRSLRRRLSICM